MAKLTKLNVRLGRAGGIASIAVASITLTMPTLATAQDHARGGHQRGGMALTSLRQ